MRSLQFLLVAAFCVCSVAVLIGDEPQANQSQSDESTTAKSDQATAAQIAGWIKSLDDDDLAVRKKAVEELTTAGKPALPALEKAIENGIAESVSKCFQVLNAMLQSKDEKLVTAAKETLGKITTGTNLLKSNSAKRLLWDNQDRVRQDVRRRIIAADGNLTPSELIPPIGQYRGRGITRRDNETGRMFTATEPDLEVRVEITENGKTTEYTARDEIELKKRHPQIYNEFVKTVKSNQTSPATAEQFSEQHLRRVEELLEMTEVYLNRLSRTSGDNHNLETNYAAIKPVKEKVQAARDELDNAAKAIRDGYKQILEK